MIFSLQVVWRLKEGSFFDKVLRLNLSLCCNLILLSQINCCVRCEDFACIETWPLFACSLCSAHWDFESRDAIGSPPLTWLPLTWFPFMEISKTRCQITRLSHWTISGSHHFGREHSGKSHFGTDFSRQEHFNTCTIRPCRCSGKISVMGELSANKENPESQPCIPDPSAPPTNQAFV